MLTAKDINNKRFEQTRPGYKPEEVDDFLREIAAQLTKMQKEREEDEKKIEVLVESVREYKKDEEALKDALIGAQKQSRAVLQEARENADKIIAEAHAKADGIIGNTRVQLEKEKHCLAKMQQEVSDFKAQLLAMYKAHLEQITAIPDFDDDDEEEEAAPAPQPVTSAPAAQPVTEQPAAPTQTAPPAAAEPQRHTPPAQNNDLLTSQNMEATKVVDRDAIREKQAQAFQFADNTPSENRFGNLKFGQNK